MLLKRIASVKSDWSLKSYLNASFARPSPHGFAAWCVAATHGDGIAARLGYLDPDIFNQTHRVPDPTLGSDGHYRSSEELRGKNTTEDGRPSKRKVREIRKGPLF